MNDKLLGLVLVALGAVGAVVVLGGRASAQPSAGAQDNAAQRTLHVSGTAVVYARPDSASINVGVSKSADTVGEAKAQCDSTVARVDAALRAQGVKPQDIQTIGYNVYAGTKLVNKKPNRFWTIQETYAVKVHDVTTVSKVLDGAISAGATNVDQIQFGLEDVAEIRAKARANAVAVAKAKAEGLAMEMGVTLIEPVGIRDQAENDMPYAQSTANYFISSESQGLNGNVSNIRSGQLSASDRVEIDYAIR